MAVPPGDSRENVLLVEGADDEHVVYALRDRFGIPNRFRVRRADGFDNLRTLIPLQVREPGLRRLGIVVDADDRPADRLGEVLRVLESQGYATAGAELARFGTILPDSDPFRPRSGVWLMPDHASTGALDHVLRDLVPVADDLIELAESAVDGIAEERRRFAAQHRVKAVLRTWLAWQPQPGLPFGRAITSRCLGHESGATRAFASWLCRLFDLPAPPGPA